MTSGACGSPVPHSTCDAPCESVSASKRNCEQLQLRVWGLLRASEAQRDTIGAFPLRERGEHRALPAVAKLLGGVRCSCRCPQERRKWAPVAPCLGDHSSGRWLYSSVSRPSRGPRVLSSLHTWRAGWRPCASSAPSSSQPHAAKAPLQRIAPLLRPVAVEDPGSLDGAGCVQPVLVRRLDACHQAVGRKNHLYRYSGSGLWTLGSRELRIG